MDAFFPLSGDVSQTINPWAIWLRSANQQLGFIAINAQSSGDPEMERRVIEEVASYGRQLGLIIEALEVTDLHDLRRTDPEGYEAVVSRLRAEIE